MVDNEIVYNSDGFSKDKRVFVVQDEPLPLNVSMIGTVYETSWWLMSTVLDKLKNIKLKPSQVMGTAGALGLASGLFKASADNKKR